jgi:O-methyltransferase
MNKFDDQKTKMKTPEALYLDLLKNTLSFTLWDEPGWPIGSFNQFRPAYKRIPIGLLSQMFAFFKLDIIQTRKVTLEQKQNGEIWPALADTMVGFKRLDNLQMCIESVIQRGIEGDLIETGVWRGGACIFMRAVLAAHQVGDRRVFVADSFEGLPKPDAKQYPVDTGDQHHLLKFLAVSKEQVEANFAKYGLLDEQVVFLKGWFSDTLPKAPIK